jgi:hypothetical protein
VRRARRDLPKRCQRRRGAVLVVGMIDRDGRALGGEALGYGTADAARAAGDER